MKILFICENYYPHMGGAEVVFKNLAERYVQRGHTVTVLTQRLPKTVKKEILNGVKIRRIPSFGSRYVFTFSSIPLAIKLAREHDLIQTTTFNGAPPAWLAAKLRSKKVALTVHEVWINKWRQVTGFSWLKSALHEFLEKSIYLLPFDHYICVSNATGNDLQNIGIKHHKITVAHNGLDYEFWNEKNVSEKEITEIRERLQLNGKFTYFSWGRPGTSKGFEYLIKAVPHIVDKVPHSLLLLMLNPQQKYKKKYDELMLLIKRLKLEDNLKLIHPVSYQDLRKYIKAVDCVVVPSVAEGFGYTTVEAASMGIPLVVSNAGSLPEVVSGKFEIFENKNERDLALKVINVSQKKWQEKNIKKFSWGKTVQRYLEVYEKMETANTMNNCDKKCLKEEQD